MPPRKERTLIVLDTNILISAAISPKPSAARDVVNLWKRGFLQLVLSDEIIHEYLLVLSRFHLTDAQMRHWATWFVHPAKTIHLVEPQLVKASRDPKDDPFLGAALTGHADWIISRDDDLLVLEEFEGIPIVTPTSFMETRRKGQGKQKLARKTK
jgi:putative PIN family toxin of toxin-antitoxin system